mmetsp:Transcript_15677/g.23749  ORF Transcript_15677/g.23749 Transcript_15677/m.23749 type:complete len:404 (-) Transcript_15677:155-1366(-)|eukprot:CAMPEP_0178905092 /NCGR_PEP_ID=MMETSP0786-20121207/6067_1 /TAXON_ID=186022 /ORGANISM="Thalassionema frauenfeldii, Strain CCMP 1798" /LENGTH=403 /DNA_ID=CAMNT_0020576629 /DNA_START=77 /DNA_END=1288 /DNA_ORIENTATION=+
MAFEKKLVKEAKDLYHQHFGSDNEATLCAAAPGRVNLIGEHVDYTGGFVFPMAIDYMTVVYGIGKPSENSTRIELVSTLAPNQVEQIREIPSKPPSKEEAHSSWIWYVLGVISQYLPEMASNFDLKLAIAGNVPLGGGLSSSASLEVATARFLEGAFKISNVTEKERALRCQKAENEWCHSPCGIMDQYVSSAGKEGAALLIDCRSYEYQEVRMKEDESKAVTWVVTNSNVQHSIGGGEYPIRVAQCQEATKILKDGGADIQSLRDASIEMVEKTPMDDVLYRRAKHVVTENQRTMEAKTNLESGNWKEVGRLMNQSHSSMRDDYEVSCEEIDILTELAQNFEGVYGSRLTGGGFGGCTVTLVEKDRVAAFMGHLRKEYKARTGKECDCFETSPRAGARLLDV